MLEGRPRVNTDLTGTVRMMGEAESAIRVEIHLEDEELRLVSAHGELGRWPLSTSALPPNSMVSTFGSRVKNW